MTTTTQSTLKQIQDTLLSLANESAKTSSQKFIPTSQNLYGVMVKDLNEIAKQYKDATFELVEALWEAGAYEERILAGKLLGRCCKQDPDQALALVDQYSWEIVDWAVCDTLGMQGIKKLFKPYRGKIFELAEKMLQADYLWRRRLGIVLLIQYHKEPILHEKMLALVQPLREEKEHYIKKAIAWLDRDIAKVTSRR